MTVIQRFDSALRLNVHLHVLALYGVYVKGDDGGLRFLRLPRPSEEEAYEVALRTAKKVLSMVAKKGGNVDEASHEEVESEIEPALLACYDIAGRAPKKRIVDGPRLGKGECAVVVDGFILMSMRATQSMGADSRCDSSRLGACRFVGARTADANEGAARAALVAVSEETSAVKSDAFCVR